MNHIKQSYDFAYDQSLVDGERLINDIRNHSKDFTKAYVGIALEKDKEAVMNGQYPNLYIASGKLFPLIYWGFVDLVKKVGFSVDTTYQPDVYCGEGFLFVYSSNQHNLL
jgi:hypothetical protein